MGEKKIKLTPAQKDFLLTIVDKRQQSYGGYKPALTLEEIGFAEKFEGRFGSISYLATDAGRSFLGLSPRTPKTEESAS